MNIVRDNLNFPPKLNYTKHKAKSKVNINWAEKVGVARN